MNLKILITLVIIILYICKKVLGWTFLKSKRFNHKDHKTLIWINAAKLTQNCQEKFSVAW